MRQGTVRFPVKTLDFSVAGGVYAAVLIEKNRKLCYNFILTNEEGMKVWKSNEGYFGGGSG